MRVSAEYIILCYLLNKTTANETEIMKEVWNELKLAAKQGYMIDTPLRECSRNRIPEAVEILRDYIYRNIISHKEVGQDHIFTVKSANIIKIIIGSLELQTPANKKYKETME